MWSTLLLAGYMILGAKADGYAEDVFFIVTHGQLVATRLDPIMSPGQVSGHVHAIVGGSNFGPVYDYDKSTQSQCTTANIAVDHSNYWVPQLYNKHSNGTFSVAGLSYVNTYYQMRRGDDEPVYEFPPGFRMLAGDQERRTLDLNDPAQDAVRYVCLGGTVPEGHEFPAQQCKDGMRAQIYFPHCCWLEGSKHVAYGEGRFDGGGKCPATHPKRIMGLFYEFIFHDHEEYRAGGRVWSNGDNTGYALHADFTNGWPVGFFSKIFSYGRQCSVGFDNAACPALAEHVVKNQQCTYTGTRVVEDIGDQGAIAHLLGNNPRAAKYQESAKFNSGSPSPTQITSVPATSIIMATVKGDTPQSAPPDAIPQAGQSTRVSSAAGSSVSVAPTSSVSRNPGSSAIISKSAFVSAPASISASKIAPASNSATKSAPGSLEPEVPSASTSRPGGGGVLIGDASPSSSAIISQVSGTLSSAGSSATVRPIAGASVSASSGVGSGSVTDSAAPVSSTAPVPAVSSAGHKTCPKGGRRGGRHSRPGH